MKQTLICLNLQFKRLINVFEWYFWISCLSLSLQQNSYFFEKGKNGKNWILQIQLKYKSKNVFCKNSILESPISVIITTLNIINVELRFQ